jgi:hypothetical protein
MYIGYVVGHFWLEQYINFHTNYLLPIPIMYLNERKKEFGKPKD